MIDLFNDSPKIQQNSVEAKILFNNFPKMFNKNTLHADYEQVTTKNFVQQTMWGGCSKQPLDQIPSGDVDCDALGG